MHNPTMLKGGGKIVQPATHKEEHVLVALLFKSNELSLSLSLNFFKRFGEDTILSIRPPTLSLSSYRRKFPT